MKGGFKLSEEWSVFANYTFRFLDMQYLSAQEHTTAVYEQAHANLLFIGDVDGMTFVSSSESVILNRQRAGLCLAGQAYQLHAASEGGGIYVISFDVMDAPIAKEWPHSLTMNWRNELVQSLQRLWQESRQDHAASWLGAQAAFYLLLQQLAEQDAPQEERSWLEASGEYIRNNYTQPLQIQDLAARSKVSTKHFMRAFRKQYGMTVIQFVTKIRIAHAKRLLASGAYTLRKAALAVGYQDEFYFSRRFKQEVGISPSAFMQTRQRSLAVLDSSLLGLLIPLHYMPQAAPIHPTWRSHYYGKLSSAIATQLLVGRSRDVHTENIETLATSNRHYEIILALDDLDADQQARLAQLGPVYVLAWQSLSWREQLIQVAHWLDAVKEAKLWLGDYEVYVQYAKQRLQGRRKETLLFVLIDDQGCHLNHDQAIEEVIFGDLGMCSVLADRQESVTAGSVIAAETILTWNPDHLFVLIYEDEESLARWQQIREDDHWLECRAVRHHAVHLLQPFPWRDYGPYPHMRMIEQMIERLGDNRTAIDRTIVHGL